jgi:hypothetical protein
MRIRSGRRDVTPLSYHKGTTWGFAWPVYQNGVPFDVTGWKVRAQIRASIQDDVVLHEWTTENGGASTTDHRVALILKPADSTDWDWRDAVYDVLLSHPTDVTRVYPIAEGSFTVQQGVTRA